MDEQNPNLEGQNSNIEPETNNVVNAPETNVESVQETNVENVQENTNSNVEGVEQVTGYEKTPNINETNAPNGGNKKSNVGIVVGIFAAIIVLVVLCGAFVILRGNKGERFLKMFENDYLLRIAKSTSEIALKNNNVNMSAQIDVDDFMESMGVDSKNIGTLSLNASTLRNKENFTTNLTVNSNENELAKAKVVLNGTKLGVVVPGLFERYVAADFSDIDGLAKNLNLDDENAEDIKNKLSNNAQLAEKNKNVVKRYLKILTKQISNKINVEKNVTVKINGNESNANRHFVKLNSKDMMYIAREMLKTARKDKELYEVASEFKDFDYTWEEWVEEINYSLESIEENIKGDYIPSEFIIIEAFRRGNNTLAARITFLEGREEVFDMKVSAFNNKSDSYLEVKFGSYGSYVSLILNSKIGKNKSNTDVYLKVDAEKIKLLTFAVEGRKVSNPNIDVISDSALMLNSASEKSREKFMDNLKGKLPSYMSNIASKLPEGLSDYADILSDLNYGIEYYE